MAIDPVNTGARANDGSGDPLREAFEKINLNIDTLAAAVLARLSARADFAPLHHEHGAYVARFVRAGAPTEPPPLYGALWIDARADDLYLATGTASVADWRKVMLAP
jgi:hypothetical protein